MNDLGIFKFETIMSRWQLLRASVKALLYGRLVITTKITQVPNRMRNYRVMYSVLAYDHDRTGVTASGTEPVFTANLRDDQVCPTEATLRTWGAFLSKLYHGREVRIMSWSEYDPRD